jgi:hypothetical protein
LNEIFNIAAKCDKVRMIFDVVFNIVV